jgi:DNA-binding LytR/AlgR family response regulator
VNIAICDDEPVFLKQLHSRIVDMKLPDCEIHEFTSGKDLLSFYVKGMYEVVILDVEMPTINGLETAERIRQIDKSVIISFLTTYAEFAVQGYDVGAFRYILKNQPEYVYKKQLNSIFDECEQRFRTFTFNNKNLSFKFRLTDILYFEGHRRKVSLFTLNGELEYGGDFSTVCGDLMRYNFIMINRCILVNLDHIQNITKYDVILSNGRKIPIGKTYKDEVVARYLDYAAGR